MDLQTSIDFFRDLTTVSASDPTSDTAYKKHIGLAEVCIGAGDFWLMPLTHKKAFIVGVGLQLTESYNTSVSDITSW